MLALAIGTTTGVITIVITIVIMVVADGIHITAVGQVGPFRAATVRRIKGRVAQVGDTVKRKAHLPRCSFCPGADAFSASRNDKSRPSFGDNRMTRSMSAWSNYISDQCPLCPPKQTWVSAAANVCFWPLATHRGSMADGRFRSEADIDGFWRALPLLRMTQRDVAPVAGIMHSPPVMVVNPSLPARSVPEFITYAKANPGKVNMGSAGIGSVTNICRRARCWAASSWCTCLIAAAGTAIDGSAPKFFTFIAFDNITKAKTFIDSIKATTALRTRVTKSRSFIVEGTMR
jgi:hypothetical protein